FVAVFCVVVLVCRFGVGVCWIVVLVVLLGDLRGEVLFFGVLVVLFWVLVAWGVGGWLGLATDGFVFAGLVLWMFCFGMSRFS
ncbi:hypothetical protein RA264_28565, partial [Pseudomonas syringae pv. tagetis]